MAAVASRVPALGGIEPLRPFRETSKFIPAKGILPGVLSLAQGRRIGKEVCFESTGPVLCATGWSRKFGYQPVVATAHDCRGLFSDDSATAAEAEAVE